jgi:fumarate reductase subunit C
VSARAEARLWLAQRATAVVLAFCVAVHLLTIVLAVRGGLTAAEILGRTQGNFAWGAFYGVFVVAAAVHGAIGLRSVASEWLGFRGPAAEAAMVAIALALAVLGLRGVAAVVGS